MQQVQKCSWNPVKHVKDGALIKVVNHLKPLTIFSKSPILVVWYDSSYASKVALPKSKCLKCSREKLWPNFVENRSVESRY